MKIFKKILNAGRRPSSQEIALRVPAARTRMATAAVSAPGIVPPVVMPDVNRLLPEWPLPIDIGNERKKSKTFGSAPITIEEAIAAFFPERVSTEKKSGPQTMAALRAIKNDAIDDRKRAIEVLKLIQLYVLRLENKKQLGILTELKKQGVINRKDIINAVVLYLKDVAHGYMELSTVGIQQLVYIKPKDTQIIYRPSRDSLKKLAKAFGLELRQCVAKFEEADGSGVRTHTIGAGSSYGDDVYQVRIKPENVLLELVLDTEYVRWAELFIGKISNRTPPYQRGEGEAYIFRPEQQVGLDAYIEAQLLLVFPDYSRLFQSINHLDEIFSYIPRIFDPGFRTGVHDTILQKVKDEMRVAGSPDKLKKEVIATDYDGATIQFNLSHNSEHGDRIDEISVTFPSSTLLGVKPWFNLGYIKDGEFPSAISAGVDVLDGLRRIIMKRAYYKDGHLDGGYFYHYPDDLPKTEYTRIIGASTYRGRLFMCKFEERQRDPLGFFSVAKRIVSCRIPRD